MYFNLFQRDREHIIRQFCFSAAYICWMLKFIKYKLRNKCISDCDSADSYVFISFILLWNCNVCLIFFRYPSYHRDMNTDQTYSERRPGAQEENHVCLTLPQNLFESIAVSFGTRKHKYGMQRNVYIKNIKDRISQYHFE